MHQNTLQGSQYTQVHQYMELQGIYTHTAIDVVGFQFPFCSKNSFNPSAMLHTNVDLNKFIKTMHSSGWKPQINTIDKNKIMPIERK